MSENQSRIEVIWGSPILDAGFAPLPNLLIRNYRKIGIEHAEWGLICQLASHKHSNEDPYPSEDTLAEYLGISTRAIRKLVKSLVDKNLLIVIERYDYKEKKRATNQYNLKPMIDACLRLVGEKELPEPNKDIRPMKSKRNMQAVLEVPIGQQEHEVPLGMELGVPIGTEPEVPINRTKEKNNNKREEEEENIYIDESSILQNMPKEFTRYKKLYIDMVKKQGTGFLSYIDEDYLNFCNELSIPSSNAELIYSAISIDKYNVKAVESALLTMKEKLAKGERIYNTIEWLKTTITNEQLKF